MKTQKMSLANAQGKLSRKEMKTIMAGSGSGCCSITVQMYSNSVEYVGLNKSTADYICANYSCTCYQCC